MATPLTTNHQRADLKPSGQACPWLAAIAGSGAALIGALMFRGAIVAGVATDVAPCLLTALLTSLAVTVAGRLERRGAVVVAGVSTFIASVGGKVLAWDLLGLIGQLSGDAAIGSSWLDRLANGWEGTLLGARWINVIAWVVAPLLAGFAAFAWTEFLVVSDSPRDYDPQTATPAGQVANLTCGWRRWDLMLVAFAWVLVVAYFQAGFQRPGHSGFLDMTRPVVRANQENTFLGYAHLRDGVAIMCEEIPAIEQATWLQGAVRSDNNFRFLRAGYAFLATPLTPFFGPEGGLRALNVLAWLGSLICLWRIAERLSGDPRAGCLAVLLAAPGVGYAVHWNATTPHLTSFTLYAAGVLMLLETGIPQRPRGGRVHLAIGVTLGLISLVYNVAQMLLAVYVVSGLRTQRWKHLAGGALLALLFQPVWKSVLPALGINMVDVESEYLTRALDAWWGALREGPLTFAVLALRLGWESLTAMEAPWMLALGLCGMLCGLRKGQRLFAWSALLAPVLACTVFAPAANARGYIVYGGSALLFAAAGSWLAQAVSTGRAARWLGLAAVLAAMGGELYWSTSIPWGHAGPSICYFLGWDDGGPVVQQESDRSLRLAESDDESRLEAVPSPPSTEAPRRSRVLAYLARLVFVMGITLALCGWSRTQRGRRWSVAMWLPTAVLLTEAGLHAACPLPTYWDISQGLQLAAGESLILRIDVPYVRCQALLSRHHESQELSLFVPAHGPCDIEWRIDGRLIPLANRVRYEAACRWSDLPAEPGLIEVGQRETWEITLRNPGPRELAISGWQRPDATGMSLAAPGPRCLPAIEFRVRERSTGALRRLGY